MIKNTEGYKLNIELLNEAFPDKGILGVKDVQNYLGVGWKAADNFVRKNGVKLGKRYFISKADFANLISA